MAAALGIGLAANIVVLACPVCCAGGVPYRQEVKLPSDASCFLLKVTCESLPNEAQLLQSLPQAAPDQIRADGARPECEHGAGDDVAESLVGAWHSVSTPPEYPWTARPSVPEA